MNDPKRDRALGLIRTMQDIIDRPTTPEGEREAARSRVKALREKHNITEPVKYAQPTSRRPNNQDWSRHWYNHADSEADRRAKAKRMAEEDVLRQRANKARREREATEAARQTARRKVADEAFKAKMRDKDDMGRPLTDDEKREAQRDPLGWAAKRDQRTTNQRNEDINSTWGKAPYAGHNRTNSQARESARKMTEDYAKIKDNIKNGFPKGKPWDTATKYQAKITNVTETTSKAGNPMVVIDFTIGSDTIKTYYVLNNERGLKNLMVVVENILGAEATTMSVDQILAKLHGQVCTVFLNSWTSDQGEEKWSVQTVLKPWA